MNKFFLLISRYWPVIIFSIIYIIIFRKFFFLNLVPFPGDLLVSFFFPYNAGGWEGYTQWIGHKEFILSDVVRQLYPWKTLSIDLFKNGMLPLWNIYSFAGTPLLANVQSSVFYPINLLFFLIESNAAWIIYVMLQPVLATYFMYLFIRRLTFSPAAALFAGLGFAFLGYTTVWFEMGIVGHSALWLPFILWGITAYMDSKKLLYMLASTFGIACSILAGHAQTSAYVLIFSFIYFVYIGWSTFTKRELLKGLVFLCLGIGFAGFQIIPSIELMSLSPRDALNSSEIFHNFIIPSSHLAMFFAPDFFGNPATDNFWGKNYGEFMGYFGVGILLLGSIGFYTRFTHKVVRLCFFTALISLFISFVPFVSELLFLSQLPILSTGLPSRTVFLVGVCFVIAAAFGIDAVYKDKLKRIIPPLLVILGIYGILWAIVLAPILNASDAVVSKRNLILPTGIALLISLSIFARKYSTQFFILWIILFSCLTLEYSYFLNKYIPWASSSYMYPSQELVKKISKQAGVDRVFGYDTATIATNLPVQWRVQSIEGYDPLYIKHYAEFMQAVKTGKLEKNLSRSDASLPNNLPKEDSHRKQLALNLLGVKYILDKDDTATKVWDPRIDKFPEERFQLIYQQDKWKIYQNKKSIPRAAIFYDYVVIPDQDRSLKTLFDEKFPYDQKIVLASKPHFPAKTASMTAAKITEYTANNVEIKTISKENGILFLSDVYYPGWNAYVDGKKTEVIRADYSFRAVPIEKGEHTIIFKYEPVSFVVGAFITFSSIIIAMILMLMKPKKPLKKLHRKK